RSLLERAVLGGQSPGELHDAPSIADLHRRGRHVANLLQRERGGCEGLVHPRIAAVPSPAFLVEVAQVSSAQARLRVDAVLSGEPTKLSRVGLAGLGQQAARFLTALQLDVRRSS